jgi:hypothetical protein
MRRSYLHHTGAHKKEAPLMKTLAPLTLLLAALAFGPAWASSHGTAAPTKAAPKKAAGKADARKKAQAKGKDEKAVNVADMQATPYDCDLGAKLTIYTRPDDNQQIALRWNKRMHQMTRMQTSTGADRFENTVSGLVWIGIPAKGMLLDSKKGRQLANECRNEEQKKVVQK